MKEIPIGTTAEMARGLVLPHHVSMVEGRADWREVRDYAIEQAKVSLDVEAAQHRRVRVSPFTIEEEINIETLETTLLVVAEYHQGRGK